MTRRFLSGEVTSTVALAVDLCTKFVPEYHVCDPCFQSRNVRTGNANSFIHPLPQIPDSIAQW